MKQIESGTIHFVRKHVAIVSLLTLTLVNLFLLSPLLQYGFPPGSDSTSNFAFTVRIAEMIQDRNFRFWLPDYCLGQPLFFYYQPLPHLATALIYCFFPFVQQILIYKIINVVLLLLMPLSLYQGMRWMGFSKASGLWAALLMYSVSSWEQYGFELGTLFRWGMYSQLWGMVMTPLVLGYIYKEYFTTRKIVGPILALGLLMLTHGLLGIVVCLAIASLFLLSSWTVKQKWLDIRYIGVLFTGVFTIAAVIIIPNLLYADYSDSFSTVNEETHLGIGILGALKKLFLGEVFDMGSYPVITIGIFCSLLVIIVQFVRSYRSLKPDTELRLIGFILVIMAGGLILISGTHTFKFLEYTPVINSFLALRMITIFHLAGILLLALTLGKFWEYGTGVATHPFNQIGRYSALVTVLLFAGYLGSRQITSLQKKAQPRLYTKNYKGAINFLKNQPDGRLHFSKVRSNLYNDLVKVLTNKNSTTYFGGSSHTNLGLYYTTELEDMKTAYYDLFSIPYLMTLRSSESTIGTSIFQNDYYEILRTQGPISNFDIVQSDIVCLSHNHPARELMTNWANTKELVTNKQYICIAANKDRSFFEERGFNNFIKLEALSKKEPAKTCIVETPELEREIEILTNGNLTEYFSLQEQEKPVNLGQIIEEYTEDGFYQAKVEIAPTESEKTSWVMVKSSAHPDWKATVDGKPAEWVQMSPCFMAVAVNPGVHTVAFEFTISPLRKGLLAISLITIISLGLLALRPRRKMNPISSFEKILLQCNIKKI